MKVNFVPNIPRKSPSVTQPNQGVGTPAFGRSLVLERVSDIVLPTGPDALGEAEGIVFSFGRFIPISEESKKALDSVYLRTSGALQRMLKGAYTQWKMDPPKIPTNA